MAEFAHLHVHSDYSLLRSTASIPDLAARATELSLRGLAITDDGNLFGALHFYRALHESAVTPIIGCDFWVTGGSRHEKTGGERGNRPGRLVLLATSDLGYRNLIELSSRGYTEGFYYRPRIDDELLQQYRQDLICLTGSISGEVPALILRGRDEEARARLGFYRDLYGAKSVYGELQNHGLPEELTVNRALLDMAPGMGIGTVATNETWYVRQQDADAHDTLLAIGGQKSKADPNRFRFSTNEFYLKSAEEMTTRFAEVPHSLRASLDIAERCTFSLKLPGPMLPEYEIPEGFASADDYLRHLAREGLRERYSPVSSVASERLEYELETIIGMGFTGYFLIVWDFIAFARSRDIPVGPGRGSGAGSLVAYALRITNIDPLRFDLLFERLLNPERVSMPDFDIDFCFERRGEVIDYVTRKYGEERVSQIITFAVLKPKAAIRDVARALDLSFGEADAIAKLIPDDLRITLQDLSEEQRGKKVNALEEEPRLRALLEAGGPEAQVIDQARKLEGLHRHASTHAAGVVIGAEQLTRYVPLYRDPRTGAVSTQYSMDLLEDCGLVKMDFLGLKTLTLIRNTEELVREKLPDFSTETIPEDDEATFAMLGQGESICVFQFESDGMRRILRDARPSRIEDLIALNALYRPGPMENIPQFIDSKFGRQAIRFPHPSLQKILDETYGVIVYQEQVMEIVQIIAGFSLGQADLLRRAMGKKKREEMERMRAAYLEGATAKGIPEETAAAIFTLLEPFAGYGFNKSHAAAYSVLAYQTAYLKANHPAEFMAANLTNEIANPDKIVEYLEEARRMGLAIRPPSVNRSGVRFSVRDGEIVYGLVAIKGIGQGVAEAIISERSAGGEFTGLRDFLERVDPSVANRRTLETLILAGTFDDLSDIPRGVLHRNVETLMERARHEREARQAGQGSLFDAPQSGEWDDLPLAEDEIPDRQELLSHERELLGYYVTGHPLDAFRTMAERATSVNLANVSGLSPERNHQVLGMLLEARFVNTRRGKRMAIGRIMDHNGEIDLVAFDDALAVVEGWWEPDRVVGVRGKLDFRRDAPQFVVEWMGSPEELRLRDADELHLRLVSGLGEPDLLELRSFLFGHNGAARLVLHVPDPDGGERIIRVDDQLAVSTSQTSLREIAEHPAVDGCWTAQAETAKEFA